MKDKSRVYAYLRASTKEQDASRARKQLTEFAQQSDLAISAFFVENVSGATLKRPELFSLLNIAQEGDIILVEQIDRISRLNTEDWNKLKSVIKTKGLRIVSLDLPTSRQLMEQGDEFNYRMQIAINDLMLDLLAAVARKDYNDRRRRQEQGIVKAQSLKLYKGRKEDAKRLANIEMLLLEGKSYSVITELLNCSRKTVAKVSKRIKERESEQ